MDLHIRVLAQKGSYKFGFVAADVVTDDVNLAALRLAGHDIAQEANELLAGVARGGHPQHLAGAGEP